MDEATAHDPLLFLISSHAKNKKKPFLMPFLKWVLKIKMWALFLGWVSFLFLYPTEFGSSLLENWARGSLGATLGITGCIFLVFSGPILIIACLAVVYLILFGEEELQEKKPPKAPRFRLWTFPVLVDGPFGVVSAAECIGIFVFFVYIVWATTIYTIRNYNNVIKNPLPTKAMSSLMLEFSGLRCGGIGLYLLAFLFLPISRGSVLLRLIDIPFEHATRYHVWLGHLTMFFFTLHGVLYIIAWAMEGRLLHEILEWKDIGVANLAGVISLISGLFMWVTSLPPVRKKNFELFFYTHQLYIVFVVFLALHVGDFIFTMAAGGIFVFMLDRFLRFCQSRRMVDIISATCLPCGTLELVLSKPASLRYNALSFVFIQIRELSWLQWHPFSVSSTPLDGKHHLAVLIKVLGGWTARLRRQICSEGAAHVDLNQKPQIKISASIEGPYGHESPYHLTYEYLILVAGGIGISPFLAILRDIIHLINERKPCLPKKILVVWAVKSSDELPLLLADDMVSICPVHMDKMKLEIQIYVTRETQPPLEEGKTTENHKHMNPSVFPVSSGSCMSHLVGTGDNIWSGIYVVSSTVGLVFLMALLDLYYINHYKVSAWWYKGLLLLACMVATVIIFGGFVVGVWNFCEGRNVAREKSEDILKVVDLPQGEPWTLSHHSWQKISSTSYGCRPNIREIFSSVSQDWGHVDIGVMVCGPLTLQSGVAKECRSQNLNRSCCSPIFHFNSHSFDL